MTCYVSRRMLIPTHSLTWSLIKRSHVVLRWRKHCTVWHTAPPPKVLLAEIRSFSVITGWPSDVSGALRFAWTSPSLIPPALNYARKTRGALDRITQVAERFFCCDFIIRNIYKDLYWCSHKHWNYLFQFSFVNLFTVRPILLYLYLMFTAAVMGCVWQLVIKENDDDDDAVKYSAIKYSATQQTPDFVW